MPSNLHGISIISFGFFFNIFWCNKTLSGNKHDVHSINIKLILKRENMMKHLTQTMAF